MFSYFLMGAKVGFDASLQYLQKRYQQAKPEGALSFGLYSVIIAISSLLLYGVAAGFRLYVNVYSLLYAFVYAIVIGVNFVLPFLVLEYTNMVTTNLFSKVGSSVVVLVFSYLFLKETISAKSSIGAIIMLVAAVLPILQKEERQGGNAIGYLLGALSAVITGLTNIINKTYATSTLCEGSDAAYCFYVNVFIVLGWGVYFGYVFCSREKQNVIREGMRKFNLENLRLILLIAVVSAANTLFNLYALSLIELSFYTIITNSVGLIAVTGLSRFVYQEALNRYNYISVFLALMAIFLTSL